MGRWAARYAEKLATSPQCSTDKTAKKGLVSVLAVTSREVARETGALSALAGEPVARPDSPELTALAWTDSDIARFLTRRARLLRWGWPEPDAVELAGRLAKRDRDRDDRVNCTDCMHFRPGRCDNHRQAALTVASIGKDWSALLQRCDGFSGRAP